MGDTPRRTDFVEDIFAGVVTAGYNYFASVATLLRSPVRGSARLAVRRALPRFLQLAPQTIIVLTVCIAYIAIKARWSSEVSDALRGILIERSVDRSAAVIIVRAVCVALVLDILVRFLSYAVHARSRRRRGRFAISTLYAYAATLLYLVVPVVVAVTFISNFEAPSPFLLLAPIALLFASLPIAEVIAINCGPSRYPTILRAGLLAVAIASIAGALILGELSGEWLATRRDERKPPLVQEIRCRLDAKRMATAFVIFHNTGERPFVLEQAPLMNIRLFGGQKFLVTTRIDNSSRGVEQPIYVVGPSETAWLHLVSIEPVPVDERAPLELQEADCTLAGFQFENELKRAARTVEPVR